MSVNISQALSVPRILARYFKPFNPFKFEILSIVVVAPEYGDVFETLFQFTPSLLNCHWIPDIVALPFAANENEAFPVIHLPTDTGWDVIVACLHVSVIAVSEAGRKQVPIAPLGTTFKVTLSRMVNPYFVYVVAIGEAKFTALKGFVVEPDFIDSETR